MIHDGTSAQIFCRILLAEADVRTVFSLQKQKSPYSAGRASIHGRSRATKIRPAARGRIVGQEGGTAEENEKERELEFSGE